MTIKVTDSAKDKIKSLVDDSLFKNPVLRINISRYGWNGPSMDLVLDELTDNDQDVMKDNDVNVVFDLKLKDYLARGARNSLIVDYKKDVSKSGFFILNSRASCC